MAQIKIDFDALRSEASKMGSLGGTYEGLTGKLKTLSEQILSEWKGEASTAYGNKMADYHKQALIMIEVLQKFKEYAEAAANEFEQADNECANKILNAF
ncbi:MAG: WXG100 family type VII secretion target [Eubacteriales bacterium]|nr:WXG100 family type VII secretion target [Eubacteriales bacterium]